jgi:hypothetical protein
VVQLFFLTCNNANEDAQKCSQHCIEDGINSCNVLGFQGEELLTGFVDKRFFSVFLHVDD